jgi:hypothetical protein
MPAHGEKGEGTQNQLKFNVKYTLIRSFRSAARDAIGQSVHGTRRGSQSIADFAHFEK